jgi:hypothetical protein
MSPSNESPLARALAELQLAMQSPTGAAPDPDRRRAAHRLGELIRSGEDDLERFATRHLPGRAVGAHVLVGARSLASNIERLVALLGRSPEADAAVARFATELESLVPDLEKSAAPIAPPKRPSAPLNETSTVPAFNAGAETALAHEARSVIPIAATPFSSGSGAPTHSPRLEPQPVSVAPPSVAPNSETLEDSGGHASSSQQPLGLPFQQRKATPHTTEIPAFTLESSPPIALPFAAAKVSPSTKPPGEDSRVLPFRRTSSPQPVPIPEHLRELDLETYATLRVLLELFPERNAELFKHYGIPDATTRDQLDAQWNLRITHDSALRAEWESTYARTLAHYRNRP